MVYTKEETFYPPPSPVRESLNSKEELKHGVLWYLKTACVQKDMYAFVLRLTEQAEDEEDNSVPVGAGGWHTNTEIGSEANKRVGTSVDFHVAQVSDNCVDLGLTVDGVLNKKVDFIFSKEDAKSITAAVQGLRDTHKTNTTHNFRVWDEVADDLMKRNYATNQHEEGAEQVGPRSSLVYAGENGTLPLDAREDANHNIDLLERAFTRWRMIPININGNKCWGTLCLTRDSCLQILNLERCVEDTDTGDKVQCLLTAVTEVTGSLAKAKKQETALHEVAHGIRNALQADRCMVYKFEPDFSGKVVAEAVSTNHGHVDSMLGLCFPSNDIPSFARLLFSKVPYRLITHVDTHIPYSSLVPSYLGSQDLETSTDISECPGRWVAGCCLAYLTNMGVKGSMVFPLFNGRQLWGLIAAQTIKDPLIPSHPIRKACALLALLTSVDISKRVREASNMRQLMVHTLMSSYMRIDDRAAVKIMELLDCDCVAVVKHPALGMKNDGVSKTVVLQHFSTVKVDVQQVADLADAMRDCREKSAHFTNNKENGTLLTSELSDWIQDKTLLSNTCTPNHEWSGLAMICVRHYSIVLLRPSSIRSIEWAGKNEELKPGDVLVPRRSFEKWCEEQKGGSALWSNDDLDFLSRWCTTLVGLDEVQRINTEHSEMIKLQLKESRDLAVLAANQKAAFLRHMSHELRTPFNGMIGMMSMLLRTDLDSDQLELATTSYRCAADMLDILDDVLLVSKLESNKVEIRSQSFDLSALVERAYKLMGVRAVQLGVLMSLELKGVGYEGNGLLRLDTTMDAQTLRENVTEWRDRTKAADRLVLGDPGRVRQVLLNLLGNAIKFTQLGGKVVLKVTKFKDQKEIKKYANDLTNKYAGCSVSTDLAAHLSRVFGFAPVGPGWQPAHSSVLATKGVNDISDGSDIESHTPSQASIQRSSVDQEARRIQTRRSFALLQAKEITRSLALECEEHMNRSGSRDRLLSNLSGSSMTASKSKDSVVRNARAPTNSAKTSADSTRASRQNSRTRTPTSSYRIAIKDDVEDTNVFDNDNIAYYSLSIEDTGCGIDLGKIETLFTAFTQLDNTPSRSYEGTGLGLTISKDLVSLMGGDLVLHSTLHVGSCFTAFFALPYGDESALDEEDGVDAAYTTSTLDRLQRGKSDEVMPPVATESVLPSNANSRSSFPYSSSDTGRKSIKTQRAIEVPMLNQSVTVLEETETPVMSTSHLVPSAPLAGRPSSRPPHRENKSSASSSVEKNQSSPGSQRSTLVMSGVLVGTPVKNANSPVGSDSGSPSAAREKERRSREQSAARAARGGTRATYIGGQDSFHFACRAVGARMKEGKHVVLIVDDNHVNRMVLNKMVKTVKPDAEILIAQNGKQAIDHVVQRHNDICVVYMDLFMPEVDGWEACATIRAMEQERRELTNVQSSAVTDRVPIIALTADVMADNDTLIGFDCIMTKPVLFAKIAQLNGGNE